MKFLFLINIKLYPKKILKKDRSINIDRTMIWIFSLKMLDRSLTGKNPPEEISVKARFKESKDLIEKIFRIKKIKNVKIEYNRKILIACLKISELLNDIKLVNVFLKLSS